MAFINWTDDYKVGVRQLDADHKELFEIMNHLHALVTAGIDATKLTTIIDRLCTLCVQNFKYEEDLFDRTGYPNAAMHRGTHKISVEMMAHFRRDIAHTESGALAEELLMTLKGWALLQMQGEETKFGKFLYSKGIR